MPIVTRTITATFEDAGNEPLANKSVKFEPIGYFGDGGVVVPKGVVTTTTDADGEMTVDLNTDDSAGAYVRYKVTMPGGTVARFDLASGSSVDLDTLINAYDGSNALNVMFRSIIDAKGDLIVGKNANSAARLAVGSDGQVLTADSTAALGVKWGAGGGGAGNVATDAIFDAKGDLPVGTGANTSAKLTVGANDTFLVPDSAQTTGLKWITAAAVKTLLALVKGDVGLGNVDNTADASKPVSTFQAAADATVLAAAIQRGNHTGTQLASTILDFSSAALAAAPAETAATLGATVNASSAATPNNTDLVATVESSVVKKITWTNVKAFLKTYFDTLYVALSGNQSIDDIKTFTSSPIVPTPSTDFQAATKKYVDDSITGGGGFTVEQAQDAVGAMVDGSLIYVDATPLLQRAALTGDVTAPAGSNATTIANDAVSYGKMQNVSGASRLLGRGSASGAGDVQEITIGAGGIQMSGTELSFELPDEAVDTGQLAANAVDNTILEDMAVNTIKGRITSGTGDPEDLTATQVRTIINVANGATANSSDATLLARANHTGTQLAATISDFAATVRSTVLTGLSLATNQAIAAGDTILQAFGYLQKQITDLIATVETVRSPTANTQSGTTYTVQASDRGKDIRCTHASGCTITFPNTATLGTDFYCFVTPLNGPVTIGSDVTLRNNLGALPQYKKIEVRAIATDEYLASIAPVSLSGNETIAGVKTFSSDPLIPDEVYDATAWNGVLEPPTKNAVRDQFEAEPAATRTLTNKTISLASNTLQATKAQLDAAVSDGNVLYVGDVTTYPGDESIQDLVGAMFSGNTETGITVTYQDADGTIDLAIDPDITVRTVSGTTDTATAADQGADIRFTNAGTKTETIAATGTLGTDFYAILTNLGAGALTISPDSGVTIRNNLGTVAQYKSVAIKAIGTDEYIVTSVPVSLTGNETIAGVKTFSSLPLIPDTAYSSGWDGVLSPATQNAVYDKLEADALNATLGTDDTYRGDVIAGINAGATIAQWEAVYADFSSGKWLLADANGTGTYPAWGLAVAAYSDTNPALVLRRGFVRNDAWNWSAGPIYLSATAGGLTQTAPSTSGDKVQVVGYAVTADKAFFDFGFTYLTVT